MDIRGFDPFDNKLDFTIAGDISPEVDQKKISFGTALATR